MRRLMSNILILSMFSIIMFDILYYIWRYSPLFRVRILSCY
ncbi:unnamed protein product [Chironomus riparius]|uniref:Uncharacterized protein n=1 Tax=Chironomus riparius TaxID=315576 RepID=A0A9N9WNI4_9DIPT|nr:unnamed protein product [Chironomus riparius]